MTKSYDQRKEANKRYIAKFDDIKVRVPKGKREEYKQLAAAHGMSLNQFIISCIEKEK